jgi:hypothetical protein
VGTLVRPKKRFKLLLKLKTGPIVILNFFHFRFKMPSSRDPDYYRCFCGVHVHTFVFIVSIILVTINAIAAIGFIVGGKSSSKIDSRI